MPDSRPAGWRVVLRYLGVALFLFTGFYHFYRVDLFAQIVPPGFGDPRLMVQISGVAELAGAVGLLIPPLRRAAAWGLIALLIAVFPANIYMAGWPQRMPGIHLAHWILWARLPLQPLMIAWVWVAGLGAKDGQHYN
jgi:uncharacterized membrane protein